jgi:hypothetical protein
LLTVFALSGVVVCLLLASGVLAIPHMRLQPTGDMAAVTGWLWLLALVAGFAVCNGLHRPFIEAVVLLLVINIGALALSDFVLVSLESIKYSSNDARR